jgi:uncharacterized protein DUF4231
VPTEASRENRNDARHPGEVAKLAGDLNDLIAGLEAELSAEQRQFLCLRWRDQAIRAKRRERGARTIVLWMRATSAVLAVLVPAFLGLQGPWFDTAAFVGSLGVAAITAVEGVLRNGIRWRMSRVVADELQAEGWAFAHGISPYRADKPRSDSFPVFAARVERILNRYSDEYLQEVAVPVTRLGEARSGPGPAPASS